MKLDPAVMSAAEVVAALELAPLPVEGGYFRRTWRGGPAAGAADRAGASLILALFTPEQFSALHRLALEEVWCFHAGDPLESLRLRESGRGEWVRLGLEPAAAERVHDVVPAGVWQGTRLRPGGRWALVSCVVVPEFHWADFEAGDRVALTRAYPDFGEAIAELTRAASGRP